MPLGRDAVGRIVAGLPVLRGAGAGAVGYVVGYALTYLLMALDAGVDARTVGSLFGIQFASRPQVVGWVFYGAHLVETELSSSSRGTVASGNPIASASTEVPSVLYYAVPVVTLVGAGLLLAESLDDVGLPAAAAAGATVVVGYLPLVVLGVFASTASVSVAGESITYGPALATGVLLAGLAYPLLLGAIGGVVAAET